MKLVDETLFQNHYTRAKLCKLADRGPYRMVDYLRNRLSDNNLDIRRLKVNHKPHWCVVRWSHPVHVMGKIARGVTGLDRLPAVVFHAERDDGSPRDITYRDLEMLVLITKERTRKAAEEQERQWASEEREICKVEDDFKSEVLLSANPKSYMSIASENARRIESGEVQGYGTSGPAKDD